MNDSPDFSITDPEVQKCPFAYNDYLREEAPVYRDPVSGHYIVSRYDDVRKASLDVKNLSNKTGMLIPTRISSVQEEVDKIYAEKGWLPIDTLVTNDPPEHKFHRSLVDKVFTPKRVAKMEPYIESMVDELIDGFVGDGQVEFVSRFSVPLPMYVIADQLGVPREDLPRFKQWSEVSISINSPTTPPEAEIEFAHLMTEMQQYFKQRADDPAIAGRDCILNDLLKVDVDGRKLTMREFMSIMHNLLVAGNETTTNAISSGVQLMIEHPEIAQDLRADSTKMPAFVEETLRLRSPIQGLARKATTDITIGGVKIPEGSIVILRYGAANADPEKFSCPTQANLHRPNTRDHLAFGVGPHFCIGHLLARTEMRIAFTRILDRLDNLRFARGTDESCEYLAAYIAYGLSRLEIAFDRRENNGTPEQSEGRAYVRS